MFAIKFSHIADNSQSKTRRVLGGFIQSCAALRKLFQLVFLTTRTIILNRYCHPLLERHLNAHPIIGSFTGIVGKIADNFQKIFPIKRNHAFGSNEHFFSE